MKFTAASALTLVATLAKVNADCWANRLGFQCCKNTKEVVYVDADGEWGVENNEWCGIQKDGCFSTNLGFPCCQGCNVVYTDNDGNWGVENNDWCGIKDSCSSTPIQLPRPVITTTTPTPEPTPEPVSKYPANPPALNGGQTGKTTRYWDCCVASCSWQENTNASHPVNVCKKDGVTLWSPFDWKVGNVCSNGGQGYMCNDNQPWAINDNLAYGFVAAGFNSGNQKEWCCSCQRLEFISGPVKGKQMVVQITNTGSDLSENHFDIQMPGGGVGIFDGCSNQWGATGGWGERYGGIKSANECRNLPQQLQKGCNWRFDWFKNADNPQVRFERVQCPTELTDITGCIPRDDANQKKLPW